MKNQIDNIRDLASRETQDRYIVHGGVDEYLLPDEMVCFALTFIEGVEGGQLGGSLRQIHRELLRDLEVALNAVLPVVSGELTKEELVHRNREWAAVREAAA